MSNSAVPSFSATEFWNHRFSTLQPMQSPYLRRDEPVDNPSTIDPPVANSEIWATEIWQWPAEITALLRSFGDAAGVAVVAAYLARLNRDASFDLGVWWAVPMQKGGEREVARGGEDLGLAAPCRIQLQPQQDIAAWVEAFAAQVEPLAQANAAAIQADGAAAKTAQTALDLARRCPIQLVHGAVSQGTAQTPREEVSSAQLRIAIAPDTPSGSSSGSASDFPSDSIACQITYNSAQLSAAAIARIQAQLTVFLNGIVRNPQRPLVQQPILPTAEQQQLLREWNQTATDYVADLGTVQGYEACIHHRIEAQVERTPEAIAVTYRDQSLTYRELNHRANQLAHHLRALGVQPDGFVGLCVERSLEMVVGLLGILKAGAAYLPLDPTYPPERLALMIGDAQPAVVLTQVAVQEQVPSSEAGSDAPVHTHTLCLDRDWDQIASYPTDNPTPLAQSHNLAYIIYTSGSTGRPKGVMIEHRSLTNFAQASLVDYGIGGDGGERDRVLQFASISFDAAAEEIYPCLISGGELVLRSPEMMSAVPQFLQQCRDYGLTVLDLPTAYWHLMVAELKADPALTLPESIRIVIIGGEAVNPQRIAQWQQILWRTGSRAQLINTYGPTEATVVATAYKLPLPQTEPDPDEIPVVTIGRALRNVTTYVLDAHQQPVPLGLPGELCIGGAGVARGYLGREDLTADRFLPDPFAEASPEASRVAARLYRTGDLVRYLPNGEIDFLGRIDNQVKIRGFRIELGEIEALLTQQSTVRNAAVIVREDKPGQKQLVAYVVPAGAASTEVALVRTESVAIWRQALADKLPEYMVPSAFVLLEQLPMTPNEKVDRRSLPLPAPEDFQISTNAFVAPQPGTETQLASLWQDVLALEQVGATDNFFELGGTSLLAVKLFMQIEKVFGRSLQLSALLQAPTVRDLAQVLEADPAEEPGQKRQAQATTVVPLQPKGRQPPIFFINSISYAQLFVPHLGADRPFYCLNLFGATELFARNLDQLTLEQMAEKFVADLLTVQPQGPYYIGAYCGDTKLAIAMAHHLQSLGKTVALQAFIDPMWDEPSGLSFHGNNLRRFGFNYALEKVKNRVRVAQEQAVYRSRQTVGKLWDSQGGRQLDKDLQLYAKYQQLCDSYWPEPYTGEISVISCAELSASAMPRLAGAMQQPLRLREIPGYHHTIFQAPQLQALVEQFQQAIAAATPDGTDNPVEAADRSTARLS